MVFTKNEVPTISDAIFFPRLFGGNVMNVMLINIICDGNCRNPSLGFATKAKVYKVASQEECEKV
jgi:hypothetical protein